MNRAEKRRQQKQEKKNLAKAYTGTPKKRANSDYYNSAPEALDLGMRHHAAGDLIQAESIYNKILEAEPDQPEAMYFLGLIANQGGKFNIGAKFIKKAVIAKPEFMEAHNNLARTYYELGQLEEAVESYRSAISLQPDFAEAHYNLGVAYKEMGKPEEAILSYDHAISINPVYLKAHYNRGVALYEMGRDLEAVASYQNALAIDSDYAEPHSNLGNVLRDLGRVDEAVSHCRKSIALKPERPEAYVNLGLALQKLGDLEEAIDTYITIIAIRPEFAPAHCNLGVALKDLCRLDEAIACFRRALAIQRDYVDAHCNLVFTEQYRALNSAESLFHLHREWDECQAQAFRTSWPEHKNTCDPERRIRLGFVSPDLGRHPVGYFVIGLLENLPKEQFEIVCYSDRIADDLTDQIEAISDIWRKVRGIPDEDLFSSIIDDKIDILIDLAGQAANNRLLVFARKPAPVQVTWGGYIGTTGLSAIDYLVSDPISTRSGEEQFCQESVLRMPDGYVCYTPPDYAPDVGPLPSVQAGHITFASFSNSAKLNDEVLVVWAQILKAVKNARILIKYKNIDSPANINRILAIFETAGIENSRVMLEGWTPHDQSLARYNDVDIALDPFPYAGGLTTFEALWMGVPVITLPGKTFASRHSECHLNASGYPELVASDKSSYINLAIELANNPKHLTIMRSEMRDKMRNSPACDAQKFAKAFGAYMGDIWRAWCAAQNEQQGK